MSQIRQTLPLHYEARLSYGQIGLALGIPKATVGETVLLARVAGVDWALAQTLSDGELQRLLYRPIGSKGSTIATGCIRRSVINRRLMRNDASWLRSLMYVESRRVQCHSVASNLELMQTN